MSFPLTTSPGVTVLSTVTTKVLAKMNSIVHLPLTGGFATRHGNHYHIRVWTSEGVLEAKLEGHTRAVRAMAVQGCGGIVSGSEDHTARVWSGTACVAVLRGHTDLVFAVAVHPSNDNIVVTGSRDRTARVWDVGTLTKQATCTAVLKGHTSWVEAVAFMSDGSILSVSWDKTVRVWSPDGSCKSVLRHPEYVLCLTVLPDDTFIVVGGRRYAGGHGFVRKWAGDVEQWTTATCEPVESVTPEAFRLLSGQVVFFDAADGRETGTFKPAFRMACMPGGKVMVYGDNQVSVIKAFRHSRLKVIGLMKAGWNTYKGKHLPPPSPNRLETLSRALCLRRFCRVRGVDDKDMEMELVEPFARDIVRFL